MRDTKSDCIFADNTEIILSLDDYNDIFSDFDARSYSEKALSVDFLDETKRASKDKISGGIKLKFILDRKKRNKKDEAVIKKRLKNHFVHHYSTLKKERKDVMKRGLAFVLAGILIMMLATFVIFQYGEHDIYSTFLVVLLEPGGWFLFWEGLDIVLFESKKSTSDLRFYDKMQKCKIEFLS
jgi:hypothetical protein